MSARRNANQTIGRAYEEVAQAIRFVGVGPTQLEVPRHPLPPVSTEADGPSDMAALNAAVAQADPEGKGVPVLLRHYLKLGARAIGFSIDPAFGNAIDALMVVDLQAVPAAALKRYLGAAHAERHVAKAS